MRYIIEAVAAAAKSSLGRLLALAVGAESTKHGRRQPYGAERLSFPSRDIAGAFFEGEGHRNYEASQASVTSKGCLSPSCNNQGVHVESRVLRGSTLGVSSSRQDHIPAADRVVNKTVAHLCAALRDFPPTFENIVLILLFTSPTFVAYPSSALLSSNETPRSGNIPVASLIEIWTCIQYGHPLHRLYFGAVVRRVLGCCWLLCLLTQVIRLVRTAACQRASTVSFFHHSLLRRYRGGRHAR